MRFTIVVGTGRCGSTMLSRLLGTHPDVLSLSELFGIVRLAAGGGTTLFPVGEPTSARPTRGRPAGAEATDAEAGVELSDDVLAAGKPAGGELTGAELWRLLASPFPQLDAMIAAGLRTSEMAYPGGRFTPETGIPLISQYTLPVLSPTDPDGLFDLLAEQVPSWPARPAAEQFLALFGYLSHHLNRPVIVERSASSLHLIPVLHEMFPQARFVHLYRDGADCALSMSKHLAFRREILALGAIRATGLPPQTPLEEINAALPERLRGMICAPYDTDKLRTYPIPVEVFARDRWSVMIEAGVAALRTLPSGSWTSLRYEDLLSDPVGSLAGLADFIGMAAPAEWLKSAEHAIDSSRAGTAAAELDPATLERVRAACEPGVQALARVARP